MIKAMKQALLVLEDWKIHMRGDWDVIDEQAVTSLRQAIEEAEQKREWVGLTKEDLQEFAKETPSWEDLCILVEAKLKEKNA